MTTLTPFLLGLLVTAGLLVPLILRLRAAAAEANERADALTDQFAQLQKSHVRLQEDQHSLTQFLKEFPHLARDLFGGLTERQIPETVLNAVHRSLEPAQTVVLVKRGRAEGEPDEATRLVVAGVAPEGSLYKLGTEVPFDVGEIGFTAEAQLVMSRQDLSSETAQSRIKPGPRNFRACSMKERRASREGVSRWTTTPRTRSRLPWYAASNDPATATPSEMRKMSRGRSESSV